MSSTLYLKSTVSEKSRQPAQSRLTISAAAICAAAISAAAHAAAAMSAAASGRGVPAASAAALVEY